MEQIQQAKQVIVTELSWLQKHERIVIAAFVLALGIWGFNKWVDVSAHNADAAASQARVAEFASDQQAKQYQDFIAKQTALYEQDKAASDAKILTLMQTIANRDTKAATAIAQVSGTKTPPQAVKDLESVYQLPQPIAPTDTGAVVPTVDLQLFTVTKIQADACSADLTDTKEALTTSQSETASAQKMVENLQGEVKQDAVTLKAHDDASAKEIAQVKADARKSGWHKFWAGVVVGFLGRQAIPAIK